MDMTHSPQLFDALTQAGMQPHAARRVECELQTAIDQRLERAGQEALAQLLTKADGALIVARLQMIQDQMLTKADGALIEARLQKIQDQMLTKADGALIEARFQKLEDQFDELKTAVGQLEVRLLRLIHDQGWRLMGFQVALSAMLFAGLRYVH
jgi:hypothetical protein